MPELAPHPSAMPDPAPPLQPEERTARAARAQALAAMLAGAGVAGVALTYVDTSGIARVKGVPVSRLEHAATSGAGMSPVFDAFLLDDSITRGPWCGGPLGDVRLVPDLDRIVPLAAQPGWAFAAVDRMTPDGAPHHNCSRTFARRMQALLDGVGLTARAAFETEWYVTAEGGDDLEPACHGPAYGATRLVELSDYTRDLLVALADQGVQVEQLHPEYAPGQLEVSVSPEPLVAAADTAVLVRQTIRAVSQQHGLRASFAPAVAAGGVGNGGHVHLSLARDGVDVTGGANGAPLGPTGEAFAAGVLARLPALLALGAPSVSSYERLVPQHWAAPYQVWGIENREAAVRATGGSSPNLEVKCVDQAANPYLLLGGLVAAGIDGYERAAVLPPPALDDPALLDDAQREARGIRLLPRTLGEATDAFEADPVLQRALGERLHSTVLTVRRAEIELFAGSSPEEVAAATRWRH